MDIKNKMPEWLYRALRTFFQAFMATLAVNLTAYASRTDLNGGTALRSALISLAASAIAAGISAMMNMSGEGGAARYS